MAPNVSREDVARLAEQAGVRLRASDLDGVARGLDGYREFVRPLRELELGDTAPAPCADPRWRV